MNNLLNHLLVARPARIQQFTGHLADGGRSDCHNVGFFFLQQLINFGDKFVG
ncbi:MAG: hypothetical protein HC827_09880 [Cyanobacteria bacterium RM1_2_2]|nr:hypothetical protein [Cyanobacteria bacterium RM1_2_2]